MTIEYKIIFDDNGVTVRQTIDEGGGGKGGDGKETGPGGDGKETGPGGDGKPTGPGSGGPFQSGAAVVFGPTIIGVAAQGRGARLIPKVGVATPPQSPVKSAVKKSR